MIERVQEVKRPYFVEVPFDHPEPAITHVPIEESMRLQEIIRKMKEERLELQSSNSRIFLRAENLEANLKEVKEELAGRRRQNEEDEELLMRCSEDLKSAASGARDLRRQLKAAQHQRGQAYLDEERAVKEKRALKARLEAKISKLEASLARTNKMLENEITAKEEVCIARELEAIELAEKVQELNITRDERDSNRDAYEGLREQCQGWIDEIHKLNRLLDEKDEIVSFLEEQNEHFYWKYSGMVDMCNHLIVDVPWRLRSALEDLEGNKIPPAVSDFLFLCQDAVNRFKAETRDLKPRRGQHF